MSETINTQVITPRESRRLNLPSGKGQHPMKPHRMRMVHDLIVNYDIHRKLDMCVSVQKKYISRFSRLTWIWAVQITKPATWQDMTKFHSDEYIAFLKNITPDIQDRYQHQMDRCNICFSKNAGRLTSR